MPLLFLERLEEKEMPTLQEVKAQIGKVQAQLEIFKQFDEEIKKSEEEIEAIKAKKTGLQTFEDFKTINTKEKYIAELKEQVKKLEVERIDFIMAEARKINASSYMDTVLERDEMVKRQRKEIKEKSIELLELITNYNETYKNTAKGLAEKLEKTGIEEIFDFLNSFPKYSNISRPYVPSGVFEYTGNQNCYLNPASDLAYFVNRINSLEGEE